MEQFSDRKMRKTVAAQQESTCRSPSSPPLCSCHHSCTAGHKTTNQDAPMQVTTVWSRRRRRKKSNRKDSNRKDSSFHERWRETGSGCGTWAHYFRVLIPLRRKSNVDGPLQGSDGRHHGVSHLKCRWKQLNLSEKFISQMLMDQKHECISGSATEARFSHMTVRVRTF